MMHPLSGDPCGASLDRSFLEGLAEAALARCTGDLACCVVHLESRERWDFRGSRVGPAASLIKVPILIELHARFESGGLDPDARRVLTDASRAGGAGVLFELHAGLELTLRDLGILMTVISDNTASNMLIETLGLDPLRRRLESIGMRSSTFGRRFMEDPAVVGADNRTTACDMATCLARLHWGELLGPAATAEVGGVLERQQYREKIPLLLPEGIRVAHKTGELDGVRHDAALVLHPHHPYVVTCLTWDCRDVLAADRAISEFSRGLYDWMDRCQEKP